NITQSSQNRKQSSQDSQSSSKTQVASRSGQTQRDVSPNTQQCQARLACSSRVITQKIAAASLESHANFRSKEEGRLKGEEASQNFTELWRETRKIILPKLTSHVSNIREQSVGNDKKHRICVANYYTEVLEDFGYGWRDKKGDKSPQYTITYRLECRNDSPSITILAESPYQTKGEFAQADSIRAQQVYARKMQNIQPPPCTHESVYNKISQASFEFHAEMRAQEERYMRGTQAEAKFLTLWKETQPFIISKLTSHVDNIQSQGIDSAKQARICVANYYTEVLEDFGYGWRDKKGDKSPKYIIYFTVRYVNDDKNSIAIKILSQNKARRQ
ncbi:hypothetical protein CQA44_12095, partial [Helicobacter sp. MIT 14-3879]